MKRTFTQSKREMRQYLELVTQEIGALIMTESECPKRKKTSNRGVDPSYYHLLAETGEEMFSSLFLIFQFPLLFQTQLNGEIHESKPPDYR